MLCEVREISGRKAYIHVQVDRIGYGTNVTSRRQIVEKTSSSLSRDESFQIGVATNATITRGRV